MRHHADGRCLTTRLTPVRRPAQIEERIERAAYKAKLPVEVVRAEFASELEGFGELKDDRNVDIPLFKGVLSKLVKLGHYSQALAIANDVQTLFPKIWAVDVELRELRQHFDQIRICFWVAGIDQFTLDDMADSKAAPTGEGEQPGEGEDSEEVRAADDAPTLRACAHR